MRTPFPNDEEYECPVCLELVGFQEDMVCRDCYDQKAPDFGNCRCGICPQPGPTYLNARGYCSRDCELGRPDAVNEKLRAEWKLRHGKPPDAAQAVSAAQA